MSMGERFLRDKNIGENKLKEKKEMREIEVKIVNKGNQSLPSYATLGSAGFDLAVDKLLKLYNGDKEVPLEKLQRSLENGKFTLRGFERCLIGTGFYVELPTGYEIQIRPRSGNALKRGLLIANAPGTIDSDYRGEIGVILYNSTKYLMEIKIGDLVAQGVLTKHDFIKWKQMTEGELQLTIRGEGGYGHSDMSIETVERVFSDVKGEIK